MPLPALPENNTARLFVDYTTGRIEHTFIWRLASGDDADVATGIVLDFLVTIQAQLVQTWAVLGCRVQDAFGVVSLPYPLGPLAGFTGDGPETIPVLAEANQYNFVGRGRSSGRLVRFGLYGLAVPVPDNRRYIGSGITAPFAAAIAVLNDATFTAPCTIEGDGALWKPYVNVQANSYWETESRG